ncbi:uncharacterized protein EDB91DRAFT_1252541 [Suillus paluster]|uniref:uncharacterized protein n=1 Tax=Suillus paluster TaxID=48578 RepID=UPI001B86DFF0|nr:uncharacterized protein EDB91DRAFT_1252541 [Suillus paluster]KAG1730682.1 hypothetical protein EDB91DRAFT_1252541 [Suillus paluster]
MEELWCRISPYQSSVFFTLYWLTLVILLKKSGIQRQLLISVATLLLCIATAHLIVDFVRGLEAFVFQANTLGTDAYYSNPGLPASMALYVVQTTLADGVLVWRCYVLHKKSLFVAIPGCIVLLASSAVACYAVWSISQLSQLAETSAADSACLITFYILTMFISMTCTTLISWRIYRTRRFMPGGLGTLLPVVIVVIESGALYAMSVLALLLAFWTGSRGQSVMLDIITPIVGITFCLVVLQVHFHVGGRPPSEQLTDPRNIMTNLLRGRGDRDVGFSVEPIAVLITEEAEIVQSDMTGGKNDQSVSKGIFQL